jgi:hypothetical protein
MTQQEIRKLLGGYATDRLTEDERRILFEAALEDQELFNALQNEDALRELLDDPVARSQVRRMLADPMPKHRPHFGSRRWLLGVALPAAAAVILIAIMNRANAPRLIAPPVQIATNEVASAPKAVAPEPAPPDAKPQAQTEAKPRKKETIKAKTLARPAPAMPAPQLALAPRLAAPQSASPGPRAPIARLESTRADVASLRVASPGQIPDAVRQQFLEALTSPTALYQGPLVQTSVARGRQDGNAVRINVSTTMPAYLALYHVDAAGNVKRVYPTTDVATQVLPNIAMQIPIDPVKVGAGEKLRLVVIPTGGASVIGQLGAVGGFVNGAAATSGTGDAPLEKPRAPLVVDIPIAPN